MRAKVVGLKWWQGKIDGGDTIDSGKLYVEVKLSAGQGGGAGGYCTEELKLPSSETAKRLAHLPLPFDAEVITERVSNGKVSKEVVLDVQPVAISKPAAAVKAA